MGQIRLRLWASESGQDLIEYALLTAVLAAGCALLITVLVKRPALVGNAVIVAVFGAIIGGVAWSAKQSIAALTNRTQLGILEALSSKGPLSRTELRMQLKKEDAALRWLPEVHTDALAALVSAGKVAIIEGGLYALASPTASLERTTTKRGQAEA